MAVAHSASALSCVQRMVLAQSFLARMLLNTVQPPSHMSSTSPPFNLHSVRSHRDAHFSLRIPTVTACFPGSSLITPVISSGPPLLNGLKVGYI